MKKLALTLTAGLIAAASMATLTMTARSEVLVPNSTGFQNALKYSSHMTTQINCNGHTGSHGCGPGWLWTWGSDGWACHRC